MPSSATRKALERGLVAAAKKEAERAHGVRIHATAARRIRRSALLLLRHTVTLVRLGATAEKDA